MNLIQALTLYDALHNVIEDAFRIEFERYDKYDVKVLTRNLMETIDRTLDHLHKVESQLPKKAAVIPQWSKNDLDPHAWATYHEGLKSHYLSNANPQIYYCGTPAGTEYDLVWVDETVSCPLCQTAPFHLEFERANWDAMIKQPENGGKSHYFRENVGESYCRTLHLSNEEKKNMAFADEVTCYLCQKAPFHQLEV